MRRLLLAGTAALALSGCALLPSGEAPPAPGAALLRVADRLAANGDTGSAIAMYRAAIALGHKTVEARRGLGNALIAEGQPQAAIEAFEAVLAAGPDARAYNGLGVAHDMLGDRERAQEFFRTGLALDPNHRGLAHNYGKSLAAAAKSETIMEVIAQAAEPAAAPRPEAPPAAPAAPASKPVADTPPTRLDAPPPEAKVSPAPEPVPAPVPVAAERFVPLPTNEIVPMGRGVATTPLHGAYWRFRLAGSITREGATRTSLEALRRAPELKGALTIVAERPSLRTKSLRYAVISAPLPNSKAAETACEILITRGLDCLAEPLLVRS
jgi:tetratricopeptide (TPR) repeat protein